MASHVFFSGLALQESTELAIEEGKTLMIRFLGLGEANPDGTRDLRFSLNGEQRDISIADKNAHVITKAIKLANITDKTQVGSSIPGAVSKLLVKVGDAVKENQALAVIEAMKMETSIVSRMDGVVDEMFVSEGYTVAAGEMI